MSKSQYFQADVLAEAIKGKRANLSLRDAATEIAEVSSSTLSRLENHALPDLPTLLRVCSWLGRPVTDFVGNTPTDLPPQIVSLLVSERARFVLLKQEAERFLALAREGESKLAKVPTMHGNGATVAEITAYVRGDSFRG